MKQSIMQSIEEKYNKLGENPETYLKGLLQARPLTYWDYVEVDTLLSLQKPRTDFKDEEVFIMYHQITELLLKLMLHEIGQVVYQDSVAESFIVGKLSRLNRYTSMMINSFDVMSSGMDYNDYNTFRTTLAPASGFQSVQFRIVEISCTRLENLVNAEGKKRLPAQPSTEQYFEHLYWKDAGTNRATGEKTLTLRQFEQRYQEELIRLAEKLRGKTLEERVAAIEKPGEELVCALREFDRLYNVEWPLVHLNTARHYLDKQGENQAATGGSAWKKYLHPQFQQRKFFPTLWSEAELGAWGEKD